MKILAIRLSSIGDIVITTPILRALSQQLNAAVDIIVKRPFKSVLEGNPYIRHIHIYEELENDTNRILESESYDLVIDLHKNIRSRRLASKVKAEVLSYDKVNLQKWLMVNFKVDRLPNKHLVDRYFEGLDSLPIKNDGQGLDFFIQEVHDKPYERYLTLALGAAHMTKAMPTELIISLVDRSPLPVVLIGGPGDKQKGEEIVSKCTSEVLNFAGACSIHASASLIKQSEILITPDTGMMHIGAALQKSMIVVWGNTIPKFGMFPYYGQNEVRHLNAEVEVSCRPCSKIGYKTCPKGHFKCMKNQNPDAMINWLYEALNLPM